MQKTNRFTPKKTAQLAVAAALYAGLTLALSGLSFGPVQLRIAEALALLCFYRRDYSIALILGCFIANCFSPMALMDMLFGTFATALAVIPMASCKNIWIASLIPVLSNAVIVGAELFLAFNEPLWLSMLTVGAGELLAVTVIGCPLFRLGVEKNKKLMELIL